MLCGYIGSNEFHWNSLFHLDAFGCQWMFVSEDWWGFTKVSERNWDGGVLVGGAAELFHEFYALLDFILWTRLPVLGTDSIEFGMAGMCMCGCTGIYIYTYIFKIQEETEVKLN